jgi:sterol desaturase/sphingolipid hydroxylase (fatty acid hydroxylase superfamily)
VFDLIVYAIPAFVLLLAVEYFSFKYAQREDLKGYEAQDTRASLSMGLGNVFINAGWKLVVLVIFAGLYELTPLRIPEEAVWAWVLLFFLDDFAYYWFHRISHEVRLFWASHVVHHSSEHFNLSTALRQTWVPMTYFPFWMPIALLGYKPYMILTMQAVSLMYQFWIHTERIRKLPRPFEFVFNTPSHHRVHHGANDIYLDRNYAGIMIIWDRMFGSFQGEEERVRYGLTKNIGTFRPLRVAFHEYRAMWRDVKAADNWHDRLGYVFGGPAWQPGKGRGLAHNERVS